MFVVTLFLVLAAAGQVHASEVGSAPIGSHATGTSGAVAAGAPESVAAGLETLRGGGNAADAAAATLLALTVTDSTQFCFGGEVAILIYDAQRQAVEVVCGLGVAPRLATRDTFASRANPSSENKSNTFDTIPGQGLQAAATPAALDACLTLLSRYGTQSFAQAVAPTLRLLEHPTEPWHRPFARTLQRLVDAERQAKGDRTRGLRLVADYFYRGPIARELEAWCAKNGGLLQFSDLATHVTRIEEPVSVDYHGFTVCKCGPWTQGPYLLQMLRLLEGFDLPSMGHNRPDTIHTTIEAMKLALADRDMYYADPLFVDVPLAELLSPEYANIRRPLIDRQRASLAQRPGDPRHLRPLASQAETLRGLTGAHHDTTNCLVADRWGNVVAATPSGWSGVVAGDTGVLLGTRLQSFNLWAGHPNQLEPGKRPRITLTPTLVLKDDKPVLAISVAGGDAQDQASLQLVLNHLDFHLNPMESLAAFRFGTHHHLGSFRQSPPVLGNLQLSPGAGEELKHELAARGHQLEMARSIGSAVVIGIDPATGRLQAAGDDETDRHAGAY